VSVALARRGESAAVAAAAAEADFL